MARDTKKDLGKIVLGAHRVTYVHIKEPSSFDDGEDPKYNVTFLLPYDHPDVQRIEDTMQAMYKAEKESTFGGLPFNSPKIWNPLRDGQDILDEKPDRAEYRGHMFIKAASRSQPAVFDADGSELYDLDDVYSGCYCRAVIVLRPFNSKKGKRGFSVFINSLKFIKDGERLGGFTASHDDYEDDEPAPRSRARSRMDDDTPAPRRSRGRSRMDDEDDDQPAPRGRRQSAPWDDEDDAPAPRRRRSEPAGQDRRAARYDDDDLM